MKLEAWHDALRKGLGRALQHVGEMDVASVRPLILDSCLHNISYDRQVEDRSRWMAEMLLGSGDLAWHVPQILAGLGGLQNVYDADQALGTLARLVVAGHEELRPRVHEAFRAVHQAARLEIWTGRDALVLMDGAEALLPMAQAAGQRLLADPDEWEDEGFAGFMEGVLDAAQVRARLEVAARTDTSVAELLRRIEASSRRRSRSQPRPPPTRAHIEGLLAENRTDELRLVPFAAAGFGLRPEDAEHYFDRLDVETDLGRLERLMFMLARCKTSRASDRVLELARSQDLNLQQAALSLLEHSRDPRGPGVVRELLAVDTTVLHRNAVCVLSSACTAGDAELLVSALRGEEESLTDSDDVQAVVIDLVKLRGAAAGRSLVPIFDWVYERAFCGCCRASAVEALVGLSALDATRRAECLFDANDDVRAAVA